MRIIVLAPRFVSAIIGGDGRVGFPFHSAVSGDEGKDGGFGGADLDTGCLIKQGSRAMSKVAGIRAKTAVEECDEEERGPGETEQAVIERAQSGCGRHGKQLNAFMAEGAANCGRSRSPYGGG